VFARVIEMMMLINSSAIIIVFFIAARWMIGRATLKVWFTEPSLAML
jgi:hypothetical protein